MKHFLFLPIILLFCAYSYAQQKMVDDHSPITSTKKVILPAGDTLMIPVVSDKYPELKKALSDTNLFLGEKLDSIIKRGQTDLLKQGIISFNYQVTFVSKDVISLKLDYNTLYIHPDHFQKWLTLNIHTGTAYPVSKEINATGLKWICNNYRVLLKKRILDDSTMFNELKADEYTRIYKDEVKDLIEDANMLTSEKILSRYIFTDKGIYFTSERRLSDIIETFEPQRDWLVSYNELKPYVLPGALVLKKWKK